MIVFHCLKPTGAGQVLLSPLFDSIGPSHISYCLKQEPGLAVEIDLVRGATAFQELNPEPQTIPKSLSHSVTATAPVLSNLPRGEPYFAQFWGQEEPGPHCWTHIHRPMVSGMSKPTQDIKRALLGTLTLGEPFRYYARSPGLFFRSFLLILIHNFRLPKCYHPPHNISYLSPFMFQIVLNPTYYAGVQQVWGAIQQNRLKVYNVMC